MDLHVKYRPTTFEEVRGQVEVVRSLKGALKKQAGHALLFSGPSGTGKTTLARIVAKTLGCLDWNIVELDAATHTGVEAMRDLMGGVRYSGLGANATKVVIVDECHALSSAAWQSLLKIVEEPPEHLYWCFCTTEPQKVPKTISNRCLVYHLSGIAEEELFELLKSVVAAEKMETPEDVLGLCAEIAEGSPRKALTALAKVAGAKSRKSAARALQEAEIEGEAIANFCRLLLKTSDWRQLKEAAKALEGTNPESIRRVVLDWMTKVALGSNDPQRAAGVLTIISAFAEPYPPGAQLYPLLLSLGQICFTSDD